MNNYTNLVDVIIKDEMTGCPRHELLLSLGQTPAYLVSLGLPNIDLAMKGKIVGKAYFDHGIAKSLIKRLPEVLATPKHVFQPENRSFSDSVVVLTLETKGESPIIIPIRKNQRIGRGGVCYNLISSIYGKEGPDPVAKWTKAGLLLWSA